MANVRQYTYPTFTHKKTELSWTGSGHVQELRKLAGRVGSGFAFSGSGRAAKLGPPCNSETDRKAMSVAQRLLSNVTAKNNCVYCVLYSVFTILWRCLVRTKRERRQTSDATNGLQFAESRVCSSVTLRYCPGNAVSLSAALLPDGRVTYIKTKIVLHWRPSSRFIIQLFATGK